MIEGWDDMTLRRITEPMQKYFKKFHLRSKLINNKKANFPTHSYGDVPEDPKNLKHDI